jgi:hypothetical protein
MSRKNKTPYSTDFLANIHAGLIDANGVEIKTVEKEETIVASKEFAEQVEAKVVKPKSKGKK